MMFYAIEAFLQIKFSIKHKIYEPELDYLSNTCDSYGILNKSWLNNEWFII